MKLFPVLQRWKECWGSARIAWQPYASHLRPSSGCPSEIPSLSGGSTSRRWWPFRVGGASHVFPTFDAGGSAITILMRAQYNYNFNEGGIDITILTRATVLCHFNFLNLHQLKNFPGFFSLVGLCLNLILGIFDSSLKQILRIVSAQ